MCNSLKNKNKFSPKSSHFPHMIQHVMQGKSYCSVSLLGKLFLGPDTFSWMYTRMYIQPMGL